MRPVAAMLLSCAMAAIGIGVGGCARQQPRQFPKPIETSYPSPDYPPQSAEPAASRPGAPGGLVERPLGGTALPARAPVPPPAAVAPPPAAHYTGTQFDLIDADHNGRITLEEWRAFQEREFRRLDKNDDGVLTREEFSPASPARPSGRGAPTAP